MSGTWIWRGPVLEVSIHLSVSGDAGCYRDIWAKTWTGEMPTREKLILRGSNNGIKLPPPNGSRKISPLFYLVLPCSNASLSRKRPTGGHVREPISGGTSQPITTPGSFLMPSGSGAHRRDKRCESVCEAPKRHWIETCKDTESSHVFSSNDIS